jgi:tetratricopeptide (TPR) repeat protein
MYDGIIEDNKKHMKKQHKTLFAILTVMILLNIGYFYFRSLDRISNEDIVFCKDFRGESVCFSHYMQLGIDSESGGLYRESIPYFVAAQRVYERNQLRAFYAFRNQANAELQLKNFNAAIGIYKELSLLDNHPDVSMVYLDIIRAYDMQQKYEEALVFAQDGFEKFGDTRFLYKKAQILESLGRYNEEVLLYEQLRDLIPERVDAIQFKIDRLKRVHNL